MKNSKPVQDNNLLDRLFKNPLTECLIFHDYDALKEKVLEQTTSIF